MAFSVRTVSILLILANIVWAGGFIANKIALDYIPLWQILLGRVSVGAICYIILYKRYLPVTNYKSGDWKWLLAMVLCEPCLLFTFETSALQYTTASQASMIVACFPFVVAAGAWIFYKESISRRGLFGMGLAVAGVILVSFNGGEAADAPNPLLGNLLICCALLSSTCYALIIKKLCARYSFLFLSALQCVGGVLFFLPKALLQPLPAAVPPQAWAAILYLGLGVSFFTYLAINYAISRIKAGQAMLYTNLIPVFTLILAFVILGERLTPLQYCGAALVLAGIFAAGSPQESKA